MTAQHPLTSLIERLEKASGPDRELDQAIVGALYPQAAFQLDPGYDDPIVYHAEPLVEWEAYLPAFTGSIDAALTLVPENISYELVQSSVAPPALSRCRLWDWRRSPKAADPENEWLSGGNRPLALNIIIAALRARAALTPREQQ